METGDEKAMARWSTTGGRSFGIMCRWLRTVMMGVARIIWFTSGAFPPVGDGGPGHPWLDTVGRAAMSTADLVMAYYVGDFASLILAKSFAEALPLIHVQAFIHVPTLHELIPIFDHNREDLRPDAMARNVFGFWIRWGGRLEIPESSQSIVSMAICTSFADLNLNADETPKTPASKRRLTLEYPPRRIAGQDGADDIIELMDVIMEEQNYEEAPPFDGQFAIEDGSVEETEPVIPTTQERTRDRSPYRASGVRGLTYTVLPPK